MNEGSSPPVQEKLREQIDQRSSKVGERVAGTAGDLRSVSEELRKQGKDAPARYAERAAEQTERVGAYLKQVDSEKMLSDLEDFGRRQPLALLAGGLVIGIAGARLLKASSHGRYQSRSSSEEAARELGTPAADAPRGVYAEGQGEGIARERQDPAGRESVRQSPVPSGAVTGQ